MIPFAYSSRNLIVRWRTTAMTAGGFVLVVTAIILMLAFLNGAKALTAVTGQAENVVCLQKGISDEVLSRMDRRLASRAAMTPGVAAGAQNRRLASRELFMVVTQSADDGTSRMMQVRGVYPIAMEVHTQVRVVQGRMFRRHLREVVVGVMMARSLGVRVGDRLSIGKTAWEIVGTFSAGGSAFESEVWVDLDQLGDRFHRQGTVTSVVLRTPSPQAAAEVVRYLAANRRIDVTARTEPHYYEQLSEPTKVLRSGATLIALLMATGAVLGMMNTMFAAIAGRVSDIAVMRLIGFGRLQILAAFLLEAMLIALIGGTGGLLCGYALNGLTLTTAVGATEVAFAFNVNGPILLTAAAFTVFMGLVGGLLPAIAAMRIKPLDAFR